MECSCPAFCRFSGATAICAGALTRCQMTRFENNRIEDDAHGRPIVDWQATPRSSARAA